MHTKKRCIDFCVDIFFSLKLNKNLDIPNEIYFPEKMSIQKKWEPSEKRYCGTSENGGKFHVTGSGPFGDFQALESAVSEILSFPRK